MKRIKKRWGSFLKAKSTGYLDWGPFFNAKSTRYSLLWFVKVNQADTLWTTDVVRCKAPTPDNGQHQWSIGYMLLWICGGFLAESIIS